MSRWLERLCAFLLVCGAFAYNQWQLSKHTARFHKDVQTYVYESCVNGNSLREGLRVESRKLIPDERDKREAERRFAARPCFTLAQKIKL